MQFYLRQNNENASEYDQKCHNYTLRTIQWDYEAEKSRHNASKAAKVKKKANIRNQYNQVLHLTWDTIWENDKNTRKHHTQESQEDSPFPAGDYKTARNRQDSITKKNTNNFKDPQKKHHLGTVSKIITGGLKHVSRYQPHS